MFDWGGILAVGLPVSGFVLSQLLTHEAIMTSLWRQNDVVFWRHNGSERYMHSQKDQVSNPYHCYVPLCDDGINELRPGDAI